MELHYFCYIMFYTYHSQDADLPSEGEVTVSMVLAGDTSPGSGGRKLTSTSSDSQSSTSAGKESSETAKLSKYSRDDEKSLPKQQTIPTRSSPSFEEEYTSSSVRAQAQQDEEKTKVYSAPLVKPSIFEEQHASSVKVQSSYPLHQHDESPPSTGEQKSEQHLEGRIKTAPIATITPLESPPFSSLSQVDSSKHSLCETVQQKTRVEPDSPLCETEIKTESSRGLSKSRLTSASSSEIFHSFSEDEEVEPFPALSSSVASSELTMPYSSEWKLTSLASPLTTTLTAGVSGGGGVSGLDHTLSPQSSSSLSSNINTAKVSMYYLFTDCPELTVVNQCMHCPFAHG